MKLRNVLVLGALVSVVACSGDPSGTGGGSYEYPSRPPKLGKAEGWDYKNDPKKLGDFLNKDLVYSMGELPLEGMAQNTPWPDTYWPTYKDSTNTRWKAKDELSPLEKYDVAFNGWKADAEFMKLRPFDADNCAAGTSAWDKDYYEKLGPAAKYQSANKGNEASRDGVDSDGDGQVDECDDNDGVESWWGLCHAWTPAALNEVEPKFPVEYQGVMFYPSDIKALLITIYDRSKSIIVGGRCNTKEVERDEHGRIKDPNCRDTNAGSFHVIVTNMLGRYKMAIAEDRTYDYQVWNQPVHDFKVDKLEEIDVAKANALLGIEGADYPYNPEAKRFWEVVVTMHYVTESHATDHPLVPEIGSYLRTDKYNYIVEGDADGKIIGGEWIKPGSNHSMWGFSEQPDFLWTSVGPAGDVTSNPFVSYAKVKELLAKSQIDPNAPPPPAEAGVCAGKCESAAAQTVDGRTCYCDAQCFSYGDCCEGRAAACGGPAGGSCKDYCGRTDAAPGSSPDNLCYCDPQCGQRGDCCSDFAQACN